jgi:hypothetical protein
MLEGTPSPEPPAQEQPVLKMSGDVPVVVPAVVPIIDQLMMFNRTQFDNMPTVSQQTLLEQVFYDPAIPHVPAQHLKIRKSFFRCVRDGKVVDCMGDELVVTCPVLQGQGIALFRGTMLTNDQSQRIAVGKRQYLITVGDDQVLNCGYYAGMRPPMCMASIANQADDTVYSHHLDRHLSREDNNSAVELFCEMGQDPQIHTKAVLYALWPAESFSVRMWDYGVDYRMPGTGVETPVPSTPSARSAQGQSMSVATTPATPHRLGKRFCEKVEYMDKFGFTFFDAVPELAFERAHSEGLEAEAEEEQETNKDSSASGDELEERVAELPGDVHQCRLWESFESSDSESSSRSDMSGTSSSSSSGETP